MLIGLTGQIGAGKTEVARILAARGAKIIDADRIGHDVVNRNGRLREQLAGEFGPAILRADGGLKRKELARLAFRSRRSKNALDKLVHPFLLAEIRARVGSVRAGMRPVVIDAALLLDWRLDSEVDVVVVVTASRKVRLARLEKRGICRSDALAREQLQPSWLQFLRSADFVIRNSGSRRELAGRVDRIWVTLFSAEV